METLIIKPEERRPAVLRLIGAASKRVVLSMFRCTDFAVMDALADALGRGVQVELLLTQRAKGWEKKIRDLGLYLESMGAKVHRYSLPRVKYHAKYLLVDDGPAMVTSMNLTRKCFEKTGDFLLTTSDAGIARGLARLFEHDTRTPDLPLPRDISDRLLVGPDWARRQFRNLIESANKSLRIVDHRVTDPEMVELLKQRQAAGVEVEIFGKGAFNGLKSHGKMMLIDNRLGALGSISLSPPSLDLRREVAVTIEDKKCVKALAGLLRKAGGAIAAVSPLLAAASGGEGDDDDEEEGSDE
jgi:phosphatidylserine/phosphatidylglycerophosphate/cardiolipin synthase-like enzyme